MLSIIISTYKPHLLKALEQNIAETIGEIPYEIIAINNPGLMGICKVYNQGAEQAQYDNLLFVHEDVKFHSTNWGNLLQKYYDLPELGVFGLAGNKRKFNLPYGYHTGLGDDCGIFVNHTTESIVPTNTQILFEVKVIDGVFIGMKKNVWKEIPFNEDIPGFHFYDLDISLRTSKKYKNYLVTDLQFEHFSMGNFGNNWVEACLRFHKRKGYIYDNYTHEELDLIRTLWYRRLLTEKISLKNRIKYIMRMGYSNNTKKHCIKFLKNGR